MIGATWIPALRAEFEAVGPFLGLGVMSFVYLVLDIYPQVKSFKAIRSTQAFWVLWLVFSFLDSIAFGLVYHSARNQVRALIDPPALAVAALLLLSTVGVYSILQNFTVYFAGT
jgi:hypothetical protein